MSRTRSFVTASLIALGACGTHRATSRPPQNHPPAGAGTKLTFAWPVPGKARVVQTTIDDGHKIVVR
jgi:hypothetical protein